MIRMIYCHIKVKKKNNKKILREFLNYFTSILIILWKLSMKSLHIELIFNSLVI